jgi:hypothetical protein
MAKKRFADCPDSPEPDHLALDLKGAKEEMPVTQVGLSWISLLMTCHSASRVFQPDSLTGNS